VSGIARVRRLAGGERSELGRDGLAENDCPGRAGERYARSVRRRPVAAIDRRAVGGRDVDRVDQILNGDRDAVERSLLRLGITPPRSGECPLAIDKLPGADHRLARRDTVETEFDQGFGGQPAFGDLSGGFPNGKGAEIGHAALRCFWEA
jgi:hypothetical protein